MYEVVLSLHNLLRWTVILLAILVIARAVVALATSRPWSAADDTLLKLLVIDVSLQFVVGLMLWAWLSPYGAAGLADMATTMKDPTRRFWAVEHVTMMLVAIGVVHVGAARVKRATDSARKHRSAAIFIGLSLVLVLIAIPWTGINARPWLRGF